VGYVVLFVMFVVYGWGVIATALGSYGLGIAWSGCSRRLFNKPVVFWVALILSHVIAALLIVDGFGRFDRIAPLLSAVIIGVSAGVLHGRYIARKNPEPQT